MSNGVKLTILEKKNERMFDRVELKESPINFLYSVILQFSPGVLRVIIYFEQNCGVAF